MINNVGYNKTVTFEDVIYTQLVQIGMLSTKVYDQVSNNWQRNALNYYYSVKCLESMVAPYLDKKYYSDREEILKEVVSEYEIKKREEALSDPLSSSSYSPYVKVTIDATNKKLSLLMKKLRKVGLLAIPVITLQEQKYK